MICLTNIKLICIKNSPKCVSNAINACTGTQLSRHVSRARCLAETVLTPEETVFLVSGLLNIISSLCRIV